MFDLVEKKIKLPVWLKDQPTISIAMFNKAAEVEKKILDKLNNGEPLMPRERKISLVRMSESVGKNKAYLNSRDYPELYNHILLRNQYIEAQAKLISTSKRDKGNPNNQLDKMSRSDLLERCRERGKEIEYLHKVIASNALSDIYERSLLANRFGNIGMVKTLQEDNEKLQERTAELINQVHQQQKDIISAMEEVERLERKSKISLKRVK